ncbi:mesogenin-1 [Clupea harengus]|uniref:Mesogenin-1 n=1 Tax=Clupea harengus TaxID=7950 RepID=A0A6P8GFU9_CLUHA|nr:mesogenin-1 [Clupea harengus]
MENVMDSQPNTPVMMERNLDDLTAKLITQWNWRDGNSPSFLSGQRTLHCSSSSPESLPDSMCSSPEMPGNASGCQAFGSFSYTLSGHSPTQRTPQKTSKSRMSTKRRVKASEREKMRMRSLAEALHHLRDYLPPDYSRRGQPLTKIQTLKYTIEYIKELSDTLNDS